MNAKRKASLWCSHASQWDGFHRSQRILCAKFVLTILNKGNFQYFLHYVTTFIKTKSANLKKTISPFFDDSKQEMVKAAKIKSFYNIKNQKRAQFFFVSSGFF